MTEPAFDTEDEGLDLSELIGEDLFNHPDCYSLTFFRRWEDDIATPALVSAGYRVIRWYSGDHDSFGPLVRCAVVEKDGRRKTYSYG